MKEATVLPLWLCLGWNDADIFESSQEVGAINLLEISEKLYRSSTIFKEHRSTEGAAEASGARKCCMRT